jgi:hypothetical protein
MEVGKVKKAIEVLLVFRDPLAKKGRPAKEDRLGILALKVSRGRLDYRVFLVTRGILESRGYLDFLGKKETKAIRARRERRAIKVFQATRQNSLSEDNG